MITVLRAPAFATVQDTGRFGYLASGVPRSGAMDLRALRTLNALLANPGDAAAIEWALTGGALRFDAPAMLAIGGARCIATVRGEPVEPYRIVSARAGDELVIDRMAEGRFLYVAFGGGIACAPVLGSRSTFLPGGFGGLGGRKLKTGDTLPLGEASDRSRTGRGLPESAHPPVHANRIRFVARDDESSDTVPLDGVWRVQPASDRMGYRLGGGQAVRGASITSEPVCPGTIQVPPAGEPIVLMADAPTIGGYLIAGAVISADLGLLAQRVPGDEVTLQRVSVHEARSAMAEHASALASI